MDDSTTGDDTTKTGEESSLPADSGNQPAELQKDAPSGGETQDGANQGEGESNEDPKAKTEDDGLAKFAKAQGFDPDNLTDGERKALKIAHDNQKDFHKKRQEEAEALRDSVAELHDPAKAVEGLDDEYEIREARRDAKIAQLEQYQRVNEFWNKTPEAKEYEADMNALILKEKKENGVEAAIYLSRNLDRVYKLAKAEREDPDTLKEAGRRQEREELRRKTEASADTGSASTSTRSSGKIDEKWIADNYDPSNPEHRKMVDAWAAGR